MTQELELEKAQRVLELNGYTACAKALQDARAELRELRTMMRPLRAWAEVWHRVAVDLREQDNRATDQPMFIVQQKRRSWGVEGGTSRQPFYRDEWVFVTACFTEQGCKDYIARDGHNLIEPRIYAEGSYRNLEFQELRKMLLALNDAMVEANRERVEDIVAEARKEHD